MGFLLFLFIAWIVISIFSNFASYANEPPPPPPPPPSFWDEFEEKAEVFKMGFEIGQDVIGFFLDD